MKNMSALKSWAEIILMVFLPFVVTAWAWGWPWIIINAFLFFLIAIWVGGWEVPDSKFIPVILFYTLIPTLALIDIFTSNPHLWFIVPFAYYLVCAFLIIRRP
jgi:hypothetical protein